MPGLNNKIQQKETKNLQENTGATPHELVQRQIENLDYHITDEDMEHMRISADLSKKEKTEAFKQSKEFQDDHVGTSYDLLGG